MPMFVPLAVLLTVFGLVLFKRRKNNHHSVENKPQKHLTPSPPVTKSESKLCSSHYDSSPIFKEHSLLSAYRVTVVETVNECEQYLQSRVPYPIRVIGLDCEWRGTGLNRSKWSSLSTPGELDLEEEEDDDVRRKGSVKNGLSTDCLVALLQLAFSNGEVVLVRLCKMGGVGDRLRSILSDKSVLKFGVGIGNDVKRLAAGCGVQTLGCVDLQNIAVRCGIRSGTSLQGLCLQLLDVQMDKSFHIRCGDWETNILSQEQIDYAALDAVVALHILQALVELKLSKQDRRESVAGLTGFEYHNQLAEPVRTMSVPALSQASHTANQIAQLQSHDHPNLIGQSLEAWLLNTDRSTCLLSLCQGVVDVIFKQRRVSKSSPLLEGASPVPSRRTSAYSVRRSRLYHNCRLLAPDGQLLSTMHKKKLEWYLERDLGTLVSDSPMTVQLHFEPAGRPGEDRQYYLREKENICAVCGTDKNCVRKNIVPHEYRRHFPPSLKEHLSHDILLMCVSCHQLASHHNALLKQQVAMEYGLGMEDNSSQKFKEDPEMRQVRNHARVLVKNTTSIPEDRIKVLQQTVASYYGVETSEITNEMIVEASELDPRSPNSGYVCHSEKVVAALLEGGNEKLFEFQKRWRQHFLDKMSPKFLPQFWSVEHNPT